MLNAVFFGALVGPVTAGWLTVRKLKLHPALPILISGFAAGALINVPLSHFEHVLHGLIYRPIGLQHDIEYAVLVGAIPEQTTEILVWAVLWAIFGRRLTRIAPAAGALGLLLFVALGRGASENWYYMMGSFGWIKYAVRMVLTTFMTMLFSLPAGIAAQRAIKSQSPLFPAVFCGFLIGIAIHSLYDIAILTTLTAAGHPMR